MKISSLLNTAVLAGKWAQGPSMSSSGNVLMKTPSPQVYFKTCLEQGRGKFISV